MSKKGFTLIELMVVISIISLISSIVLYSLQSAKVKAADAASKMSLDQTKKALALYYSDHDSYPVDTASLINDGYIRSVPANINYVALNSDLTTTCREEPCSAYSETVTLVDGGTYAVAGSGAVDLSGLTYRIIFNSNGGSGNMSDQSLSVGSSANLRSNTFTRAGYNFTGWAITPTASVLFADNAAVTMGNANINLYAVWLQLDPCLGTPPIGTICTGGALYAGTYNGYKYMVIPTNNNLMNYSTSLTICDNLSNYGYPDWFLPNQNELYSVIYPNRTSLNITSGSGSFWSASVCNVASAYVKNMGNGWQGCEAKTSQITNRCVRKY